MIDAGNVYRVENVRHDIVDGGFAVFAQKAFVESKEEVSLPALQKALEGTDYTIKKD